MACASKRILIVGGARGLGLHIARALAATGASLALTSRRPEAVCRNRVADLETAGAARVDLLKLELGERTSVGALPDALGPPGEPLHALVLNAAQTENRLLLRTDGALWDRLLEINLHGPARLARLLHPRLAAAGESHLLFVGSRAGLHGAEGLAAYAAGKGALAGLMKSLAAEWGPDGIAVNLFVPGYMETQMGAQGGAAALARARSESALASLTPPEEAAAFAASLLARRGVTGRTIRFDSRY